MSKPKVALVPVANHFESGGERWEDLFAYMKLLSGELQVEKVTLNDEISLLSSSVDHIKRIVHMQQSVASIRGVSESFDVVSVIEDSLKINQARS